MSMNVRYAAKQALIAHEEQRRLHNNEDISSIDGEMLLEMQREDGSVEEGEGCADDSDKRTVRYRGATAEEKEALAAKNESLEADTMVCEPSKALALPLAPLPGANAAVALEAACDPGSDPELSKEGGDLAFEVDGPEALEDIASDAEDESEDNVLGEVVEAETIETDIREVP